MDGTVGPRSARGWLPSIRADLVAIEGGLYDPVLDRKVNLGAISAAIVAAVQTGAYTVDEVLVQVQKADPTLPGSTVERTFRALLLMLVFAEQGTLEIIHKARTLREKERELTPLTLPDLRFGCLGTGDCCQSYVFGPLSDHDLATLEEISEGALRNAMPDLDEGPLTEERLSSDGKKRHYLRSIDRRCVFHTKDGRCGIHAHFGEDKKPFFCRLYPWQEMVTIDGLKLYDRGECSHYGITSAQGTFLRDDLQRVLSILSTAGRKLILEHPLVILPDPSSGDLVCDYGYFLRLQAQLCDDLALVQTQGQGGPALMLDAISRRVQLFCRHIAECPLEEGGALAAIQAAQTSFWNPVDGSAKPTPDEMHDGLLRIANLAGSLINEVSWSVALADLDLNQGHRFHFVGLRDFATTLQVLRLQAAELAGVTLNDSAATVPETVRAALAMPSSPSATFAKEQNDALRRSLQNQLFGRLSLIDGRLLPALLRLTLGVLFSVVHAKLQASLRGSARFGMADFNAGHTLAQRVLGQSSLDQVFLQEGSCGWPAFGVLRAAGALL